MRFGDSTEGQESTMLGSSASAGAHLLGGMTLAIFSLGSVPMAVIADKGHVYKGTLTLAIPVSFQFSDGRVTCSGEFPSFVAGEVKSYTVTFNCNRNLKGIAIFTDVDRLKNGGNGAGGIIRFSDGTAGTFITGDGAAAF